MASKVSFAVKMFLFFCGPCGYDDIEVLIKYVCYLREIADSAAAGAGENHLREDIPTKSFRQELSFAFDDTVYCLSDELHGIAQKTIPAKLPGSMTTNEFDANPHPTTTTDDDDDSFFDDDELLAWCCTIIPTQTVLVASHRFIYLVKHTDLCFAVIQTDLES